MRATVENAHFGLSVFLNDTTPSPKIVENPFLFLQNGCFVYLGHGFVHRIVP